MSDWISPCRSCSGKYHGGEEDVCPRCDYYKVKRIIEKFSGIKIEGNISAAEALSVQLSRLSTDSAILSILYPPKK